MLQWIVKNWERGYVRFDFEISKNGLEKIDINIKVIVSSLTVLENNQQKIKLYNTKLKLVKYWLILKIMRDL